MKEITLTEQNFEQEVLNSDEPILVDFWATWCGPCRMLAPILEEIAEEGKVRVGKVNVDEQPGLADKFNISVIPTVKAFKNGEQVGSTAGYQAKEALLALLD